MLSKRKRQQEELERLQRQYALLSQKLDGLEERLILETRSDESLRLRHDIKEAHLLRAAVELEIETVEEKLDSAAAPPQAAKPVRRKAAPQASGIIPVAVAENPYNPWQPSVPPQFVGRDKECQAVTNAIMERRSISLVGDFNLGKSSLLAAIAVEAEKAGQKVVLLSGLEGYAHCLSAFIQEITGNPADDEPDRAADGLAEWLRQNTRYDLVPLLLMDDVDGCFERFPMRFFERLRGMLGRISVIFASHRELDLLQQELQRTSTLQNCLQIIRLGLLDELAAETLVQAGSAVLNATQLQMMREWAGRHPFYLQLLGMHLVRAARGGDSDETALDNFYTEAAPKLRDQWQHFDERERTALRDSVKMKTISRRSLRVRGLVTEKGQLFGRILQEWLEQEI